MSHFSTWMVLDSRAEDYKEVREICEKTVGKDNEPFDLKVNYEDLDMEFIYFRGISLGGLKEKVQELTGLAP